MAEASIAAFGIAAFGIAAFGIAAFGAAAGVAIALAIVCFILRGKGHSQGSHNHDYDKVTSDDAHIHQD